VLLVAPPSLRSSATGGHAVRPATPPPFFAQGYEGHGQPPPPPSPLSELQKGTAGPRRPDHASFDSGRPPAALTLRAPASPPSKTPPSLRRFSHPRMPEGILPRQSSHDPSGIPRQQQRPSNALRVTPSWMRRLRARAAADRVAPQVEPFRRPTAIPFDPRPSPAARGLYRFCPQNQCPALLRVKRQGKRSATSSAPRSDGAEAATRSAGPVRPTCSKTGPTSASSSSSWDTRSSKPPRSTPKPASRP
jgi:hypothetical protein